MPDDRGITLWWMPDSRGRGERQSIIACGPRGVAYQMPCVFQGWLAKTKLRWPDNKRPSWAPLPPAVNVAIARVLGLPGARPATDDDWTAYARWRFEEDSELRRLDEECRQDPLRFMGTPDYHRLREEAVV